MLEQVLKLLSDADETDPKGLLLLNLATQMQEHSGITWTLDNINTVVTQFQSDLDDLEG